MKMKTVFIFNVLILLISFVFARSTDRDRISRLKCQEYDELFQRNNICNDEGYPFVGVIGFENEDEEIQWTCSASLVSDQYVLSVAHCARTPSSPAKYVRLGGDFDKTNAKIFLIAEIIRHPDFNSSGHYNDVALFKLEKPVDFTKSIQPACLYTEEDLTEYDVAGFSFWGKEGQRDRGILVHEKSEVAAEEDCKKTYEPQLREVKFEVQFCNKHGDVACELNSGGVFLHKDEELSCMQNIAGLVDVGKGICSGNPGLNVKVSAFVDWIESVLWPKTNHFMYIRE